MRLFLILLLATSLYAAKIAIDFRGNETFSKHELYKALGIERSFWQRLIFRKEKPQVEEKLLPILLEQLQDFYKEQGFWHAQIDITLQDHTAIFIIKENEPLRVAYIQTTSDFPIEALIPFHVGDRFVATKFVESKERIRQKLLESGYCSYDFRPKAYIFEKKNQAFLVYSLQKGSICHIKSIDVAGLKTIDKKVVLSHIYLKPAEPFSLEKVRYSYRKLYSLQYFRFLNIDYSKKIQNEIFLQIKAKERQKRNVYKVGLGFDTQNGIHANFYYKHLNYHQFQPKIELFYSNIKKSAQFSLFYPSIQLGQWFFDGVGSIGYERNTFESFSQSAYALHFQLLKEWFHLSAAASINLERIRIYNANECVKEATYNLFYPKVFLLYDRRDSKIAPTSGFYLKESFSSSLGAHTFVKNALTAGFYLPFEHWLLFAKATFGTIFAQDLPPNKLFYAGGAKSNRAYTYRALHALDSSCKLGAKTVLETTVEPRFLYSDNLSFALFWDRSYLSAKELHIGPYKDGVGVGVLYTTPLGQLKFYFGFNPQDLGQNAINLYLGASF